MPNRYPHGLRSLGGVSAHDVLVGLGLETDDHSAGTLCTTATLSLDGLDLDTGTVYEAGQPGGQLSNGRAQRLAGGLVFGGADMQTVVAYVALSPGQATLAQTQAALQAFMRVVRRIVT